jgi:cation diffusion facilitator CzcD-associated flavoprotein CzcO
MDKRDVLVVGAGPAGLATGAPLRRLGVPAVISEQAGAVAASWRAGYDRLRPNAST